MTSAKGLREYTTQEALEYLERRFAAGQSKEYRKRTRFRYAYCFKNKAERD